LITNINLDNVASFKNLSTLETDKKVNLIYGLNGTGKSTFSNFLYDTTDKDYSECSITGLNNEEILVYNQKFINDYFYEENNLKGIFTLSKENKDAVEKIKNAQKEKDAINGKRGEKQDELTSVREKLSQIKLQSENTVWEIKTTYTGGDRVLEFCLDNLRGSKDKLFNHIVSIVNPDKEPEETIDNLKDEVELLQGDNSQYCNKIPLIKFTENIIEEDSLFSKEIVGNENSTVAELIKKLGNSDWVKQGLEYLPDNDFNGDESCPFCQEKTITPKILSNIKSFFDETYENNIKIIKKYHSEYKDALKSIPSKEIYNANLFVTRNKIEFERKYDQVLKVLGNNIIKIEGKLKTPSKSVTLEDPSYAIETVNTLITKINQEIGVHNIRIASKDNVLKQISQKFWDIMRWKYDQTISLFGKEKEDIEKKEAEIAKDFINIEKQHASQNQIIIEQQKNTVNLKDAIISINKGLIDLGIDNFQLKQHSDNLYKICRENNDSDTFQTLSEGEKMIISFLYFIERCKGKNNPSDTRIKKIVVIDDPISSLSHIFVFNIGRMIINEFLNTDKYEQVFLLTHSLYFFYELTDTNHDRRRENQELFRMIKNRDGSHILEMKYEEIQNDYHSYWKIIKDDKQPPALIANCMRNIIEYFFNFMEKIDLSNVIHKPELQDNKYQAFCRYINRESHSLGQNIFDYKEFDYNNFKDAFRLVFETTGYIAHHKKMIK
jgi:wobble nucleotide-excising tRNase